MNDGSQFAGWVRKILGEKEFAAVLEQPLTQATVPPIQIYSETSKRMEKDLLPLENKQVVQQETRLKNRFNQTMSRVESLRSNYNTYFSEKKSSTTDQQFNSANSLPKDPDSDSETFLFDNDQDLIELYELYESSSTFLGSETHKENKLKSIHQPILQLPNKPRRQITKLSEPETMNQKAYTTRSMTGSQFFNSSRKNNGNSKAPQSKISSFNNTILDNSLSHLQQRQSQKGDLNVNQIGRGGIKKEQQTRKKVIIIEKKRKKKIQRIPDTQKQMIKQPFDKSLEKEIILDFLMQPLNTNETMNRENPAMGVVFYLHLKNVIKTSLKNGSKVSKYQLMSNVDDSMVRRGKCSLKMAEWIYNRKFFNKDFVRKKRKRGRRTLEKSQNGGKVKTKKTTHKQPKKNKQKIRIKNKRKNLQK
ncbi:hypothetical protein M0813_27956 [Anaeramoeba flamelloides]|uniref:Uncharacterized protein n=1 Tax=Anaeramoeba flamelloides TaxID=1746091 RepID=A0ABQ8XX86_9EUKA|nr:hypothetical protein M0813_27956 [Anaeramoeba flamelloides]